MDQRPHHDGSDSHTQEWARGWRALLAAFLAMGVGWNFTHVVASLFLKPMQSEFGWSRTELSFAPMASLLMTLLLPMTGALLDRFGARPVAITGLASIAATFLLFAVIPASHVAFYSTVVCLALAGSICNSVVLARGVATWFDRHLGIAIGLMMAGASVSAAIVVPLLAHVIDEHGWRAGFMALSCLTLMAGLPPVLLWFREPGALPSGMPTSTLRRDPLRVIASTVQFWQLIVACGLAALPIGAFLGHLIPLLTDQGLTSEAAASFGSVFAVAVGFSRICNGALLDRFHPPLVIGVTLMLSALGVCALDFYDVPHLSWGVLAGAIAFIGFAQGAEGDYIKFFSIRLFGVGNFARVVPIMAMVISLGMALGGLIFAKIFDLFGSYEPGLIGSALLYAIGAAVFASIRMQSRLQTKGVA